MARLDRQGSHRGAYEKNRRIILKTQNICGICGKPVDLGLKYPDPLAPAIDHIIPLSKGGHPSSIDNLQLSHSACNRQKSDKIFEEGKLIKPAILNNRDLPHAINWTKYQSR